jgi:hypothetical protein
MSEKVILKGIRGSYVYVNKPNSMTQADGSTTTKYSMQVILDKSDVVQINKIRQACEKVARAKFGDKVKLTTLKMPMRDGDDERDEAHYENCLFFNANSDRKPGVNNRQNTVATADQLDELCFSGAYFHVSVTFYPFDRSGNKGIAVGLNNVMLNKAGDRLDGTVAAGSDFINFAEAEDDDDIPFDLD